MKFAIIDYGTGNIYSIKNALTKLGIESEITDSFKTIDNSSAIILPGVGAFYDAARSLKEKGLDEIIKNQLIKGKTIIGICLGMQLLFENSTEGQRFDGLGIVKGCVRKIPVKLKLPHMGWNNIIINNDSKILNEFNNKDYFYFVHSYYVIPNESNKICAYTDYGIKIPAIISSNNIIGIQFHPEKSGKSGLRLLNKIKEMIV